MEDLKVYRVNDVESVLSVKSVEGEHQIKDKVFSKFGELGNVKLLNAREYFLEFKGETYSVAEGFELYMNDKYCGICTKLNFGRSFYDEIRYMAVLDIFYDNYYKRLGAGVNGGEQVLYGAFRSLYGTVKKNHFILVRDYIMQRGELVLQPWYTYYNNNDMLLALVSYFCEAEEHIPLLRCDPYFRFKVNKNVIPEIVKDFKLEECVDSHRLGRKEAV